MKKTVLFCLFILAYTGTSFAQKFAYIDMKYILSNLPEYNEASKKLDAQSTQWQKEIQDKYDAIDKMESDYKSQQVLLTDDLKKQKQEDIEAKKKEAKEMQTQYFGYQGQLFKLHEQLVKPIQDKVYDAVQKIAGNKGYDAIFDKSGSTQLMYVNPKLDISDQVLNALGYSSKVNVPTPSNNSQSQQQKAQPADQQQNQQNQQQNLQNRPGMLTQPNNNSPSVIPH